MDCSSVGIHDNTMLHAVLPPTLIPGGTYRPSVSGASPSAHHPYGSDLRWSVRCSDRGVSHPRPRRTGGVMRWRGVLSENCCMKLYRRAQGLFSLVKVVNLPSRGSFFIFWLLDKVLDFAFPCCLRPRNTLDWRYE